MKPYKLNDDLYQAANVNHDEPPHWQQWVMGIITGVVIMIAVGLTFYI